MVLLCPENLLQRDAMAERNAAKMPLIVECSEATVAAIDPGHGEELMALSHDRAIVERL